VHGRGALFVVRLAEGDNIMTIEQIINKVKDNDPKADIEKIKLAYEISKKAHGNQKRETGEPYVQHSLHTAFVLAQIKADHHTVIAGILHDIPEDTEYALEDIEQKFGPEVTQLVAGVTKLSKIKNRKV